MRVVIKIGGSLSIGSHGPREEYFKKILPVLKEIDSEHEVSVCIGGGKLVRDYCESIAWTDLDDDSKEMCLIELIKANVRLLSYLLDKEPLFELEDFEGQEVVVGGIKPGRSTDANAASIASEWDADLLIKMTDVEGIYDEDPSCNEGIEKIDKLSFADIDKILKEETEPVNYGILDPIALRIIKKEKIETVVMSGREPSLLHEVIRGRPIGTRIGY